MWVLKFHGKTLYINHVECDVPWSTKETPENSHTKGSIKVKEVLLTIDENNNANITKLTVFDKIRLRNQKLGITRIMFQPNSEIHKALKNNEFKHSPFKFMTAACATSYIVCDLLNEKEVTIASLKYGQFRILQPNEHYYKGYDSNSETIPVDYGDKDTPYDYY